MRGEETGPHHGRHDLHDVRRETPSHGRPAESRITARQTIGFVMWHIEDALPPDLFVEDNIDSPRERGRWVPPTTLEIHLLSLVLLGYELPHGCGEQTRRRRQTTEGGEEDLDLVPPLHGLVFTLHPPIVYSPKPPPPPP